MNFRLPLKRLNVFNFYKKQFSDLQNIRKLVSLTECNDNSNNHSDLTDLIKKNIESQNKVDFQKNFSKLTSSNMIIENDLINTILQNINDKGSKNLINEFTEYLIENNIKLSGINYSHLINNYLKINKYYSAFISLLASRFDKVNLDFSTHLNLLNNLEKIENTENRKYFKYFLFNSLSENFDKSQVEIADKILHSPKRKIQKQKEKKNQDDSSFPFKLGNVKYRDLHQLDKSMRNKEIDSQESDKKNSRFQTEEDFIRQFSPKIEKIDLNNLDDQTSRKLGGLTGLLNLLKNKDGQNEFVQENVNAYVLTFQFDKDGNIQLLKNEYLPEKNNDNDEDDDDDDDK